MVMSQPSAVNGPNPADWGRPLDRSPRFGALIDGKRVAVDRVWTSRSLKLVSPEEYAAWALADPGMPVQVVPRSRSISLSSPLF